MFSNLKKLNLRNCGSSGTAKTAAQLSTSSVFQTRFQINRGDQDRSATGEDSVTPDTDDCLEGGGLSLPPDSNRRDKIRCYLEALLIFLCFALIAGQLPPDVNESHYLTKAKHYWNPDWCAGDIFLGSSFSHWIFYVTTGWLTKLFSLPVVAWIGRCITWALLAFAWQRFSWKLLPARGLSVLSAIFFLLLNERFHLAGEWVVGGLEAKGFAYFFVLIALGSIVVHNWRFAWPMLGAAMAFHVLVGGWAFIATSFAWVAMQWIEFNNSQTRRPRIEIAFRDFKSQLLPFCAGAAIGLLGLIPPLLADQAANPLTSAQAHMFYVNHRIAHHLKFDAFPVLHVARFTAIIVFCFLLSCWLKSRYRVMYRRMLPFYFFCIASLLISFGGLLLSGIAEQNEQLEQWSASLLRFYWFRLSDFAIPAATALSSCLVIYVWLTTDRRISTRLSCLVFIGCIVAATGLLVVEKLADPRPRADMQSLPSYEGSPERTMATYRNWVKACQWIADNTPGNATFITPHQQQTFKWYSGRSEVVCWKDIPQDAAGIGEWRRRLNELYEPQRLYEEGLLLYSDEQLRDIANRYKATHLLVPQHAVDLIPTALKQIYPENRAEKSTYAVFEF